MVQAAAEEMAGLDVVLHAVVYGNGGFPARSPHLALQPRHTSGEYALGTFDLAGGENPWYVRSPLHKCSLGAAKLREMISAHIGKQRHRFPLD